MRTSASFLTWAKRVSIAQVLGRFAPLLLVFVAMLPSLALADISEEQKLTPTANSGADAGKSSAIFGDTAVVGAPGDTGDVAGCVPGAGAAYVFTRSGAIWSKAATLCADASVDLVGGVAGDQFGAAVSINAGNIAVGAPGANSATGSVYVFSGSGSTWTQNATTLNAGAVAGGGLGTAVSISGFTVAAGAPHANVGSRTNVGVTIVYTSNDTGTTWTHTTFRANGGQARTGGLFGAAVSLSGSTILVGAPGYHTGAKQNSGTIFIFVNNGSVWTQQTNIRPANTTNAFTGTGVSLFQNTAAFGAPGGGSGGKGAVYVYSRSGTTWTAQATVNNPGAAGDNFGSTVAIEGSSAFNFLAVGAPGANSAGGNAYEYGSSGGAYTLLNGLVATDNAAGDAFGTSIGLDSGRVVVGAPFNDSTDGAAYIFLFESPSATTITGFSVDPSLTGVPYTVSVKVADNTGGTGTPTGTVLLDDSNGGTCTATLAASGDADGHAIGSCQLTSSFFGSLTMTATYGGDLTFSSSGDSVQHSVVGNHLAFSAPLPDVLQGDQVNGVTVQLLDGSNAVITSDSTTQVTLSVDDSCGNTDTIGTLTLSAGVATFTNTGPRFYTLSGMPVHAVPVVSGPTPANGNLNIVTNPEYIFADGFDDCQI